MVNLIMDTDFYVDLNGHIAQKINLKHYKMKNLKKKKSIKGFVKVDSKKLQLISGGKGTQDDIVDYDTHVLRG